MTYNNCDFKEALKIAWDLTQPSIFTKKTTKPKEKVILQTPLLQDKINKLLIKKTQPLQILALIQYLESRVINPSIAKDYIQETYYNIWDKSYFWISFKNNSWWLELNNKYFKWWIWTKDITTIKYTNSSKLFIFEGLNDFLAYISIAKDKKSKDYLVLNSVSMVNKAIEYIKNSNYKQVETYLDNDEAGKNTTWFLLNELEPLNLKVKDKSNLYSKHKDLNDYLIFLRDKKVQDLQYQRENNEILERVRERE